MRSDVGIPESHRKLSYVKKLKVNRLIWFGRGIKSDKNTILDSLPENIAYIEIV